VSLPNAVCSQQCADRCAARIAVLDAWYAELAIKALGYRGLALVVRLTGGFCFLLAAGLCVVELQEAPFNRIPLLATITFVAVLLGLAMACAIWARGLDRQTRESHNLLTERNHCGLGDSGGGDCATGSGR
jgi:hypothetical protein